MPDDGKTAQVRFVRRVENIAKPLWEECFPAPLEGWFWYHTMETCGLDDQFVFHYALIERDGRPVGIAPCFLHDVPIALVAPAPVAWVLRHLSRIFPRAGCQRTLFVGSPCSDEGTIGLVPGTSLADVIGGLRAAIRVKARQLGAPMIVFKDFPKTDLPVLTTSGRAGEFVATVSFPGTVVALPASGKDAYYRSLTHNQRHNLLKKLRRSRELLPLETSVVAHPTDRELAEIFGLFMQTYVRGRTKFERLGLRFFEQIREQEPASFILQRDQTSGELVAFMLVFCIGGRVVNKFIGLNYPRGGNTFLYFRLFDAALDFACARGANELQSGQTGYRAKLDLGHRLVPLFNVFHHEQPLVHAVFRTIGRRVTWRSLDPDLAAYLGTIRPHRHQTAQEGG
jgi:hypothetical protein